VKDASALDWSSQRVLVTGASGFIGTAVCKRLLNAGATVLGLGRGRPPTQCSTALRGTLPRDAAKLVAVHRPQLVLHLASPIALQAPAEDALRPGIVDATLALADATAALGIPLVHVGTCAEYGAIPAPHQEGDPCQPTSAYGRLKLEACQALLDRSTAQPITVLRPFRTFGPGDTRSLVAQVCQAVVQGVHLPMTDGAQVREWNHVDVIAEAILRAAARPAAQGRIWNLGGGPRLSVAALARRIVALGDASEDLLGLGELDRRAGEVSSLFGDHQAAQALWGPIVHPPLDQALGQTLAWHRTRREGGAA
jgi:nucleoside-diphosphate-sugar epimerase